YSGARVLYSFPTRRSSDLNSRIVHLPLANDRCQRVCRGEVREEKGDRDHAQEQEWHRDQASCYIAQHRDAPCSLIAYFRLISASGRLQHALYRTPSISFL